MASTLYCTFCEAGYAVVGVIPTTCPACGRETKWVTDLKPWPFPLSVMDKKFLRSIRIKAENSIP